MNGLFAAIAAIFAAIFKKPAPALTEEASLFPFDSETMERAIAAASAPHKPELVKRAAAFRATALRYPGATEPLVIAHLLAQLAHESGGFRFSREVWGPTAAQLRYEGRKDLGNTESGDGRRFAGLFDIQLTGRYNHEAYAKYAGISIEQLHAEADDLLRNMDVSFWYICVHRRGFVEAARGNDIFGASVAVNGINRTTNLPNGFEDRRRRFGVIAPILGVATWA